MERSKNLIGFTFIELLVTMSIMVLLLVTGLGSYREFSRRQQIDSAVREVKTELRRSQQEATVGKKPDHANCNNSDLIGYKVRFINSTSFEILAECVDGAVSVSTKQFPPASDIEILSFGEFTFNALAKGVSMTVTISIRQISTGEIVDIRIDQNGEIK